ncbi:dentin sialophosphoprotein-like [Peromyscus californicus insignis]|uniref:dentin sialophosphoprotein-like n=1 Tax=Peromyscus californicus insignis TaxID=564181 RepID=UPI0022A74DE5|nr:dentin sialophosphoprotein-like [Peromyscus californicus insignis]
MMRKLGLGHSKSFSVRPETANGHVKEKACGTSDDLSEEHPQASEEGSKSSLVVVQSRKHRYIVAILRKLGIRCSVTSTINDMSETMLQKTCGTNDVSAIQEKMGFRSAKVPEQRDIPQKTTLQKVEKSCSTYDDIDDEEEDTNEDDFEDRQLTAPQEESARSSKVEPKRKPYDTDDPDETDSENEMNSKESSFLGSSSDTDDPDETDSEKKTSSKKRSFLGCSTVRSMMRKLGLGHSKSFSVRPETANGHVKEKACGTSDDSSEEHPQASEEGSKSSLVVVQSRKHRYIVAILRKLGIRSSVTSTINDMSETMLQKTCGTNDVSAIQEKMGFRSAKVPEQSDIPQKTTLQKVEKSCSTYDDIDDEEEDTNEDDFEDRQLTAPQEESARSSKVEPKRKPYDMDEGKDANVLCKESSLQSDDLGSDTDDPDETDSENEMNSKESSFLGSSSDTDDPDETDSEKEMSSKKRSFLGCSTVRSMMRKLGLGHSKSFSVRPETANGHVKEKACGTSDDSSEEHPQASEEGSKSSLVVVQSRKHRYIVAILRKLGIRSSVTSTINDMSETMLQKTCGTNDVSAIQEKMGFRSAKVPEQSDIPQKTTLQKVEKSCSTYDDIDDEEEDTNEDDFDPAELESASVGPPRAAWEE